MLPPVLSEQLCSLLPGQDRLAFSVIFTLDCDAKVLKKWFGKTIIRSSAKLSYSDAQRVIDDRTLGDAQVDAVQKASDMERDIHILQGLAKKLRARRFQNGALSLANPKLIFSLDEDGLPSDCGQYQSREANTLIEEVWLQFYRF